jgi:hypothetical protein
MRAWANLFHSQRPRLESDPAVDTITPMLVTCVYAVGLEMAL